MYLLVSYVLNFFVNILSHLQVKINSQSFSHFDVNVKSVIV